MRRLRGSRGCAKKELIQSHWLDNVLGNLNKFRLPGWVDPASDEIKWESQQIFNLFVRDDEEFYRNFSKFCWASTSSLLPRRDFPRKEVTAASHNRSYMTSDISKEKLLCRRFEIEVKRSKENSNFVGNERELEQWKSIEVSCDILLLLRLSSSLSFVNQHAHQHTHERGVFYAINYYFFPFPREHPMNSEYFLTILIIFTTHRRLKEPSVRCSTSKRPTCMCWFEFLLIPQKISAAVHKIRLEQGDLRSLKGAFSGLCWFFELLEGNLLCCQPLDTAEFPLRNHMWMFSSHHRFTALRARRF